MVNSPGAAPALQKTEQKKAEPKIIPPFWEDDLSKIILSLQWCCPFFAAVLLSMPRRIWPGFGTFAVSRTHLILDPLCFEKWNPNEVGAVLLHEVSHLVREHVDPNIRFIGSNEWARTLAVEHQANSDAKQIISTGAGAIGNWKLPSPDKHVYFTELEGKQMMVEEIYDWIMEHQSQVKKKYPKPLNLFVKVGSGGEGKDTGEESEDHIYCKIADEDGEGDSSGRELSSEEARSIKDIIAGLWSAIGSSSRGSLPGSMVQQLDLLAAPAVPWDRVLKRFAKQVLDREDRSALHPNWRSHLYQDFDVIVPGKYGTHREIDHLVVHIDTSGSVYDVIDQFLSELSGIADIADLCTVIICDAAVSKVVPIRKIRDIMKNKDKLATGGGGTSHIPVFEEIKKRKLRPRALISLTDGYTLFPSQRPHFPVLWVTPDGSADESEFPFGNVVRIPKPRRAAA